MNSSTNNRQRPQAIILAAGKGIRMGSDRPKVAIEVAGRPMLWWVVQACRQVGVSRCVVVVGYKADQVRAILEGDSDCVFVDQPQQLGTGHATRMAEPLFEAVHADVFVLAGDGPLIRPQTLGRLLEVHRRRGAAATLATSVIDDPTGYGRIVRGSDGSFQAIVEQKDASVQQQAIREVYPSYACFRSDVLFSALRQVNNRNAQGEYYVTDVPALLKGQGHRVEVVDAVPPEDVLGINTLEQFEQVDAILRRRLEQQSQAAAAAAQPIENAS